MIAYQLVGMLLDMRRSNKNTAKKSAKEKLLEAGFSLIRNKGYSATTVDDLCREAGVTKGTFFHYFNNKETYAVEAAKHWSKVTGEFFKTASYHKLTNPFERFLGYIKFRKEILKGTTSEFTCLVGTMVQEAYSTHEVIRDACRESIFGHAEVLETDIKEAKDLYAPAGTWTPKSLALHTQAVIQGSFILAKAGDDSSFASESIDHLINYVHYLFNKEKKYVP